MARVATDTKTVTELLYPSVKRGIDMLCSATGLAMLAGPLTAVAVAIKLDSRGPVFYRGERVGKDGRVFRIFKFRSMVLTKTKGPDTTSQTDDRITRVGRFIRRYKVDELPQLINVLIGDMSMVGPRPEVKWCVDLYTNEEKEILSVRPGMTDWASIKFNDEGEIIEQSGYNDPDKAYLELIRPEKLRLQRKYIREKSLGTDIKIVANTIATLVSTRVGNQEDQRVHRA